MTTLKPTRQQLISWSKLNMTKYRHQGGLFLAEGLKVLQELLKSTYDTAALLTLDEKKKHLESFLSTLPGHIKIYTLDKSEWKRLSQDSEPEGIMALVKMPHSEDFSRAGAKGNGHLLLLHEVNNPNNLGAVMRTAHWFGIKTIVLSTNSVDFTNPKVVRSSMGSLFHMRIIPEVDFEKILPELKKDYFLVGSNAKDGTAPHGCKYKTALLLGNESHGLPEKFMPLINEQWSVPGKGGAESLSLPHAAAIMIYKMTEGET